MSARRQPGSRPSETTGPADDAPADEGGTAPTDEPSQEGADATAERDDVDDGEDGEEVGPEERGSFLATLAAASPQRPPRRTGVFVDPDDLREHVGQLLRAILGGYEVDAFGNFTFTHENARIFVTVGGSPIGPTVGVFSVTNLDIDLTAQLAAYLLTTNHTLGFGAFSYDDTNRSVWLRHTLLGTTLDGPELQSAVAAVATTAAHLDDRIRDRFGGRTFQESPGDVQRSVEPPGSPPGGPGATGYL
jgi:hypothetical protein